MVQVLTVCQVNILFSSLKNRALSEELDVEFDEVLNEIQSSDLNIQALRLLRTEGGHLLDG